MNPFIKRKALTLAFQPVISETMNKIKPVSKGGIRLATDLDIKLAVIEMSHELKATQRAVSNKADKVWRANI
jgi:hypothetical protein